MDSPQIRKPDSFRVPPPAIVAAIVAAMALSFAAGAASVSPKPRAQPDAPRASGAVAIDVGPFEYFPGKYTNQATEVEPLPPQF